MKAEKPWLQNYDVGVPHHLQYPNMSVPEYFFQKADLYGAHDFLISSGRIYSYSETASISKRIANFFQKLGIKAGERVGICLPNIPEFVFFFYGVMAAGGVVVALNPAYNESEVEFHLQAAGIRYLVGLSQNRCMLEQVSVKNKIDCLILVSGEGAKAASTMSTASHKIFTVPFEELLEGELNQFVAPGVEASQPAVLQFSGGTTGTPKPAIIAHSNLLANSLQFRAWLSNMQEGQEVFMAAIPLYHVYGMVIALNVAMTLGAVVVLMQDPRNINKLLEAIQKYGVTFFPSVPTLYHAINQHPDVVAGKYNLRSIKACISGSAPLLKEIRIKFEKLTRGKLVEGYGLTEAPTATHCNPIQGENREGSIGLPLPDVDCRIVDLKNPTRDVKVGESGELLIRSPQVMQGYFNQPEETKVALAEGWLHTGDIARMDADGYFYIIGRSKELIKVNGLQVWPNEIEEVISKIPGVMDVAVAGIPDLAKGERIKAWIVKSPNAEITPSSVIQACRDAIVHYKVPSEVEFVETIPRTPVGKVLRRKLVQLDIEKKRESI